MTYYTTDAGGRSVPVASASQVQNFTLPSSSSSKVYSGPVQKGTNEEEFRKTGRSVSVSSLTSTATSSRTSPSKSITPSTIKTTSGKLNDQLQFQTSPTTQQLLSKAKSGQDISTQLASQGGGSYVNKSTGISYEVSPTGKVTSIEQARVNKIIEQVQEKKFVESKTKEYTKQHNKGNLSLAEANKMLQKDISEYQREKYLRQQGVTMYPQPRQAYYNPFTSSLVEQSVRPEVVKEQGYIKVNVIGEQLGGGKIVESKTGLLTENQLKAKGLFESISKQSSITPTTFVIGGKEQQKILGLTKLTDSSSYQLASFVNPTKQQDLKSVKTIKKDGSLVDILFRGSSGIYSRLGINDDYLEEGIRMGKEKKTILGIPSDILTFGEPSESTRNIRLSFAKIIATPTQGFFITEEEAKKHKTEDGYYSYWKDPQAIQTLKYGAEGAGFVIGASSVIGGSILFGVSNVLGQQSQNIEYGKSSFNPKETAIAFGSGALKGAAIGAGTSLLFKGASKAALYGVEKVLGKAALTTTQQLFKVGGNILISKFGGEIIGGGFTASKQLYYGDIRGASITGASISGELVGFGAVGYGQRRISQYSEVRKYAKKLEPKTKIEFYKAYKEAKSLRGIKPEIKELDFSRLELVEKNQQTQEFLREYFSSNKKLIVGGSISQQPQFETGIKTKRPGDIDVYVRSIFGSEYESKLGKKFAVNVAKQLKSLGISEALPKGEKVYIGDEKFIEFHSYKSYLKPNIEQVTPIYYPALSAIRKTPSGIKILGLDIQASRKVLGYYLEPVISGKVRLKDLPAYESIRESLIKTKLKQEVNFNLKSTGIKYSKKIKIDYINHNSPQSFSKDIMKLPKNKQDYSIKSYSYDSSYKPSNRNIIIIPYKKGKANRNINYIKKIRKTPYFPYNPYRSTTPTKKPPIYSPYSPYKPYRSTTPTKKTPIYSPYSPYTPYTPYTPTETIVIKPKKEILGLRQKPLKVVKPKKKISGYERYQVSFTSSALGLTATKKEVQRLKKAGILGGIALRPIIKG